MENLSRCHVSLTLKGKIHLSYLLLWTKVTVTVQNFWASTTHLIKNNFWGLFNCPQFSSHPACLSTRLVVLSVYLRDWAETTAACLITFPLTRWSHSRPVVFCCMDSDSYSTCCIGISWSPTSDWKKALLQWQWDLHSVRAACCDSVML